MNIRSLLLILIGLLYASTAYAAEGNVDTIYSGGQIAGCENASSRGCDEKNHIYNAGLAPSYSLNKYTRAGTKIGNLKWDYTIPSVMPEGGGDQGRYTVTGEYTCASGSTWNFQTTSGSMCWGAHTFYSEPNCAGDRNVASYGAQSPGGLVSGSNTCSNGVCVVDYQVPSSPHFITADTNDNMMALLPMSPGTKGFVVNNYCGSQPYWLERASVEPSKYLMIPTKCGDYKSFMDAQPSATRIENACHPVTVSVCPSPPSRPAMPPHPGCGGYAHGSSWCSGGYRTETGSYIVPGTGTPPGPSTTVYYDYQVCNSWSYCNCGSVSDTPGGTPTPPPTIPTVPGPTPTPEPLACNWPGGGNGTSCSFAAVSANSGQSVSINNNASGFTGTLSATCNNGSWTGITTVCDPVHPEVCNWPGGGNGTSCYFPAASANSGSSMLVNNTAAGYSGALGAACNNGNWEGMSTSCNPIMPFGQCVVLYIWPGGASNVQVQATWDGSQYVPGNRVTVPYQVDNAKADAIRPYLPNTIIVPGYAPLDKGRVNGYGACSSTPPPNPAHYTAGYSCQGESEDGCWAWLYDTNTNALIDYLDQVSRGSFAMMSLLYRQVTIDEWIAATGHVPGSSAGGSGAGSPPEQP